MSYRLTSLHSYPVKSFRGLSLNTLEFDTFGPAMDRRFMLVDDAGRFVTQRSDSALCFLSVSLSHSQLLIEHDSFGVLAYAMDGFAEPIESRVWQDTVAGLVSCQTEHNEALSRYIGRPVRLIYMPDTSFRQVDRTYFDAERRVSFADGFPVLLCNSASLLDLNNRLNVPVPMSRFRPNIVIDGSDSFEEDSWKIVRIGEIELAVVKPCSRCIMTTIDDSGKVGREPLKTLATFRRNEHGVCFGQNLVPLNTGVIKLGDKLEVLV